MSPVAAFTRRFGAIPALAPEAGSVAKTAAAALTSRTSALLSLRVVARIVDFTWSGVQSGWRWRIRATVPATTGAAIEVPPARRYCPPTMQLGHSVLYALLGARVETIRAPGAATSGFMTPSW